MTAVVVTMPDGKRHTLSSLYNDPSPEFAAFQQGVAMAVAYANAVQTGQMDWKQARQTAASQLDTPSPPLVYGANNILAIHITATMREAFLSGFTNFANTVYGAALCTGN